MQDSGNPDGMGPLPDELVESQQFTSGILRKKLYDQNLSDWSARYRKNKTNLDALIKDCDLLRTESTKSQREVDELAQGYKQLEDNFQNGVITKYEAMKNAYEAAMDQKLMLQAGISENRKQKSQLTRDKKTLTNDHERKVAELMRMAEVHDKLEDQTCQLTKQLGQLVSDRRRMERELDEVRHNLRTNTELGREVTSEISIVQGGIRDSIDCYMAAPDHQNTSQGSNLEDIPGSPGQS